MACSAPLCSASSQKNERAGDTAFALLTELTSGRRRSPPLSSIMPKLLLAHLHKPVRSPPYSLDRRSLELANSVVGILLARDADPRWEEALGKVFSPEGDDMAPVVARIPDPDAALAFFDWARRRRPPWADPADSLAYSALLRLLARFRRLPEAGLVLEAMRSEGRAPTHEASGALLAAYADSGEREKALEVYASMRDQDGFFPHVSDCNCLLKLLVKQRHHELAREVYDEMVKREGGADNYSTGIMVNGLCLEGRMDEAKRLMENRWGVGCIPSAFFYNTLIDGYCRKGDIRRGYALFTEMKLRGFLPTVVSYGIVINGLCTKGNLVEISKLISEMKARGLQPNLQIYNNVMDSLCKHGSVVQAKSALRQMIGNGLEPDIITYNILISALCRDGKVQGAEKLLREAVSRRLEPNKFSYTPVIHGYCQIGDITAASNLLVEMVGNGHKPDLVTYAALIQRLAIMGEVNEALATRQKMMENGIFPDAAIYNILISGLCKKGMFPSAKKLLEEMLDHNVVPDEFVYATLIDACIRNENLSEAKKIFEFMSQKGIMHGIVIYNVMIKGYCKFGLIHDALLCIKRMKKDGYLPDEFTYTTVINGYARQYDLDRAMTIFIDMMKRQCKPNVVTYSALINGYCQKGDVETAEVLFNYMQYNKVTPNVVTYSILIGSFFKNSKMVKAISYFENMLKNKCLPNDVTFRQLIKGLTDSISSIESMDSVNLQHQHGHAIFSVFKNMICDGWDQKIAVYNVIIFCLCKHQMLKNALELRDKMIKQGCRPDYITFLFLLHGVCAVGMSKEWNNILSCQFQQQELEMALKYARLIDTLLCQRESSEVSLILQKLLEDSDQSSEFAIL